MEGGEGGQEGGGWGGVDGNGEGEMGRGAIGTGRGWQCLMGRGQREEEMERRAMRKRGGDGEDGKGAMGRGERDRDGEKKGQEEGRFHRWI